jgi:hypothetical protein
MRSIVFSLSITSSLALVGCLAEPTADDQESVGDGDGKADGASARQAGACRLNPLLKHPTSSFPDVILGDKLPFALDTMKVQEKIEPKFGGGFVTHTVAFGTAAITTDVRQLDPDLAIVQHPFTMDVSFSRPRPNQFGNLVQDFRFHSEAFDVFTDAVRVHDVVTTRSAFSPLPYTEQFYFAPGAAQAATGELVGLWVFCNFKEVQLDEAEFEDTSRTIDDVAR